jgi:hypothetical protein
MKQIKILLEDSEYKTIMERKGRKKWKEYLMEK